jgi:Telomere regulation protein Stn1
MVLDDGSGATIEVACPKVMQPTTTPVVDDRYNLPGLTVEGKAEKGVNSVNLAGVDLGSVVKVKGTIREMWGMKQIILKRITIVKDTNEEVQCWRENVKFRQSVLERSWSLSEDTVKECYRNLLEGSRKREKEEKEVKRKDKRNQRKAFQTAERKKDEGKSEKRVPPKKTKRQKNKNDAKEEEEQDSNENVSEDVGRWRKQRKQSDESGDDDSDLKASYVCYARPLDECTTRDVTEEQYARFLGEDSLVTNTENANADPSTPPRRQRKPAKPLTPGEVDALGFPVRKGRSTW